MSPMPPHIEGQYRRAQRKQRHAWHKWGRFFPSRYNNPHFKEAMKWGRLSRHWSMRMKAILSRMEGEVMNAPITTADMTELQRLWDAALATEPTEPTGQGKAL